MVLQWIDRHRNPHIVPPHTIHSSEILPFYTTDPLIYISHNHSKSSTTMKLSQAATALLASAIAVSAFTVPSRNSGTTSLASRRFESTSPAFKSGLFMSDGAVMDAETVEEGVEKYE